MNIVHTEASCGWGGQEIRILEEARGLAGRGHTVHLLCPPEARIFEEAPHFGVTVSALPIARKKPAGVVALRHWLAENTPDVINTHSSTDSWLAALACATLRKPPPIVRTRHISTPINTGRTTRWLYQRACSHVVVTGIALKEQLVRENGFAPDSITSIPTGIDLGRFAPRERNAARQILGLDVNASYAGILATLRDWKGHTVLFDALDLIKNRYPSLRLLVIGDGPYRDRLDAKLRQISLVDRVDFVGHQRDAERWLNALDVFVLPSWGDEGVSQALMQAMASALPIVTTPVGSLTEVIHDQDTGLIVPTKDSSALAAALTRLLDDQACAARLGAAARRLALERCGREMMLDRMETLFRRFSRSEHI